MGIARFGAISKTFSGASRRSALGFAATAAALALVGRKRSPAKTQDATPMAGERVATAPAPDASGIAFVPLLVGGIVHAMPSGPVEVRISRLAMAPGTVIEASVVP